MYDSQRALIEILKIHRNPNLEKFSRSLIPDADAIIGVYSADLAAFAGDIIKSGEYLKVLDFPYNVCHECDIIKGMIIRRAKLPLGDKLPYMEKYASHIKNWAVCDAAAVKVKPSEKQELLEFADKLIATGKEFNVRYALVLLKCNFADTAADAAVCFDRLERLEYGAYNADMAAAWLLSEIYIKNPSDSAAENIAAEYLMQSKRVNEFTFRKALSKITDSKRVSDIQKEEIRQLRKTVFND